MLFFLHLWFFLSAHAAEPAVFRVRLAEDLGTLDWNSGEVNGEVVYQLMEGLFRTGRDGRPTPALAEAFHWNQSKTRLDLLLRKDRPWSDGEPLCAQHFVDSWNRLRAKEFASGYAHYASVLESFVAKDCRHLRIEFTRPAPEAPALLANLVFFPIRLDALKSHPKMFVEGVTVPVNGPFRVSSWSRNSLLVLEKNPRYGGKKPYLDRIEVRFIPEDNTAKTMFELGELDWVKDVAKLLRTSDVEASGELRLFPALIVYYFGLNAGKSKLLEDKEVRQALSDALDREEIARLLGKEYRPARCWVAAELAPCRTPKGRAPGQGVIERLQAAAGSGKMDIRLRVYSKTQHKMLAEWAQGQWEKKLGIRVPIEVQESKVYWKEIAVDPAPIFLSGVTAPYAHPRAFLQEFLAHGSANWTGWANAAYDQAVNEGHSEEAEGVLREAGFVIPLYQRDTVALVKKRWKNFYINPLEQVYLSEVQPAR